MTTATTVSSGRYEDPKWLLQAMLTSGIYLRKTSNHQGKECYKVMSASHTPLYQLMRLDKRLAGLLHMKKEDKATGKLSVNRKAIRALHGKTWMKKLYKQLQHEKGKCRPVPVAKVLPKKRA